MQRHASHHHSETHLASPTSASDYDLYFDLRWRVLRAPWQEARGSERDDREDESVHLMIRAANGPVLGVGRLHLNSPVEAQVRFMAVDPDVRGRGFGSQILRALEERARTAGAKRIVLNARTDAEHFYARHGYKVCGPAPTLFGAVRHMRMEKLL